MEPKICDYTGNDYRKFWAGQNRRYEDLTERLVLRRLLPPKTGNILELGAGFGRLLPEYFPRTREIILLDFAENLLDKARKKPVPAGVKISFIKGNIYQLPLADNSVETAVMVRVSHHLEEPLLVFKEVFRVLKPAGVFIFEYANKRHALEVLRFFLGRTANKPFSREIFQRGDLVYFNFHPADIHEKVKAAGFQITKEISVSNFRHPIFKKLLPYQALAFFDRLFSWPFSLLKFGPSIFIKAVKPKNA